MADIHPSSSTSPDVCGGVSSGVIMGMTNGSGPGVFGIEDPVSTDAPGGGEARPIRKAARKQADIKDVPLPIKKASKKASRQPKSKPSNDEGTASGSGFSSNSDASQDITEIVSALPTHSKNTQLQRTANNVKNPHEDEVNINNVLLKKDNIKDQLSTKKIDGNFTQHSHIKKIRPNRRTGKEVVNNNQDSDDAPLVELHSKTNRGVKNIKGTIRIGSKSLIATESNVSNPDKGKVVIAKENLLDLTETGETLNGPHLNVLPQSHNQDSGSSSMSLLVVEDELPLVVQQEKVYNQRTTRSKNKMNKGDEFVIENFSVRSSPKSKSRTIKKPSRRKIKVNTEDKQNPVVEGSFKSKQDPEPEGLIAVIALIHAGNSSRTRDEDNDEINETSSTLTPPSPLPIPNAETQDSIEKDNTEGKILLSESEEDENEEVDKENKSVQNVNRNDLDGSPVYDINVGNNHRDRDDTLNGVNEGDNLLGLQLTIPKSFNFSEMTNVSVTDTLNESGLQDISSIHGSQDMFATQPETQEEISSSFSVIEETQQISASESSENDQLKLKSILTRKRKLIDNADVLLKDSKQRKLHVTFPSEIDKLQIVKEYERDGWLPSPDDSNSPSLMKDIDEEELNKLATMSPYEATRMRRRHRTKINEVAKVVVPSYSSTPIRGQDSNRHVAAKQLYENETSPLQNPDVLAQNTVPQNCAISIPKMQIGFNQPSPNDARGGTTEARIGGVLLSGDIGGIVIEHDPQGRQRQEHNPVELEIQPDNNDTLLAETLAGVEENSIFMDTHSFSTDQVYRFAFPELMNCIDDVNPVLIQMTSRDIFDDVMQQIKLAKGIRTVGDLAAMSIYDMRTLPIHPPKDKTFNDVMSSYLKNKKKSQIKNQHEKDLPNGQVVGLVSSEVLTTTCDGNPSSMEVENEVEIENNGANYEETAEPHGQTFGDSSNYLYMNISMNELETITAAASQENQKRDLQKIPKYQTANLPQIHPISLQEVDDNTFPFDSISFLEGFKKFLKAESQGTKTNNFVQYLLSDPICVKELFENALRCENAHVIMDTFKSDMDLSLKDSAVLSGILVANAKVVDDPEHYAKTKISGEEFMQEFFHHLHSKRLEGPEIFQKWTKTVRDIICLFQKRATAHTPSSEIKGLEKDLINSLGISKEVKQELIKEWLSSMWPNNE